MATPETLTLRRINRATLARQGLLRRDTAPPLKAIERLLALQGQWPRPPFMGLRCRIDGFSRPNLAKLFLERKVVRATFVRATLHVLSAKDYLALRPAVQPVLDSAMKAILKAKGAPVDAARVVKQAREVLAGTPRTFEEIRDHLLKANPKTNERAMGYAVRMQLPLVQVPEEGPAWAFPANARFALADEWLGKPVLTTPAPADELVLRYLASYGPASVADIQAWTGLGGLAETVTRLGKRLRAFRDERGRELWDLPEAPRPEEDVPAPVRLVPDYDSTIVARADERFVARVHRPKVFLSALRIAATLLVDGFVAGTWTVATKKGVATLSISPFAALAPRVRKEVEAEGDALVRFAEPDARSHEVRLGR